MSTKEDRAFAEGAEAYHKSKSQTTNPYDINSDLHLSWNDGFNKKEELDEENN